MGDVVSIKSADPLALDKSHWPRQLVISRAVRDKIAAAIIEAQSTFGMDDWEILECIAVELVSLTRGCWTIDELMQVLRYHAEGYLTPDEMRAQIKAARKRDE